MAVEEVVEEEAGLRSQMWKHEAMVDWINANDGVDLEQENAATIIAYAFARRNQWRRSEEYLALVEDHKAEAIAEAQARAEAREAERAAREAEKAAEAEAEEKSAKPAKATKATAPKATKTPAKATKATKAAKTKVAAGDSPFE